MLVRGPGIPDQRCGLLVATPAFAKGYERRGLEPDRAAGDMGRPQPLGRPGSDWRVHRPAAE